MSDYRYPYVQQPNWNQYRDANDGGAFTVPNPDNELYRYYQNFPFQEENVNEARGDTPSKRNIYYAAGRNPYDYKYYPYNDTIDRNLSPFSAIHDVDPPSFNPSILVNREHDDYLRHRPPSYDHQESDRIDAIRIRRDTYNTLETPHLEKHKFDEIPITKIKIRRDTVVNNFDETPIRPLKNNQPLSHDETPIKPLGYNYNTFMNDKFTPPTTVDSSIRSAPIKKKKPTKDTKKTTSFKKATSFDVPLNEQKPPERRIVTMKLNKDSPRSNNNNPAVTRFPKIPNLDRKPVNLESITQNDPKFNQNPFTVKSPSIRSNSVQKANQPKTLINTKYVIINQNENDQPTPREVSVFESNNFTPRRPITKDVPIFETNFSPRAQESSRVAPKPLPHKYQSRLSSPPSPTPPSIPILSPLPIDATVRSITPVRKQIILRQKDDSPRLVKVIRKPDARKFDSQSVELIQRAPQKKVKAVRVVERSPQRVLTPVKVIRKSSTNDYDDDDGDYDDDDGDIDFDPRKQRRKTIVHHYFK